MADAPIDVIGVHVSRLPTAIADVWPVVDESGVVVELVRTWDDERYVRLAAGGEPVDDVASTHHLMPRAVFQATVLPDEWCFIGVRRASRGLSKLESLTADDDAFGHRREYDILARINDGAGSVIAALDTSPPFTHVVELGGEFFLVQARPGSVTEVVTETEAAAEGKPADADVAEDQKPTGETTAPPPEAPAEAGPPAPPSAADVAAEWVQAAEAEEAAAVASSAQRPKKPAGTRPTKSASPKPPRAKPKATTTLDAVARDLDNGEDDVAAEGPAGAGLASALEEGIWGNQSSVRPSDAARADGFAGLVAERSRDDEEQDAARAESYAKAAAFVTSATAGTWDGVEASAGMLTLEQVRKTGCFAWDEFMNLYLPHVGFVATMHSGTPAAGGKAAEVTFVPRPESDVRPIGWHHLTGCDCEYCRP